MNVAQAFQSWINRPAPQTLAGGLGASLVLFVVACLVLGPGKRRWVGLVLGAISVLAIQAILLVVSNQTVSYRESESVRVTRPRHSERIRSIAQGAMVGIPVALVLAALAAWTAARRRRRASLPGILKAGRAHLLQKEYQTALNQFTHAVKIAPYLAEAYVGRGAAYMGTGDRERALTDFDQAIECDPRLAAAYIHRARLRTERGELDEALEDLGRVLEIHPTDPELYLNRGFCMLKKGKTGEAVADFHRVLKLTNHSDYAEPAKDYLRQLEGQETAHSPAPSLPREDANGAPESTVDRQPGSRDYVP